MLVELIKYIALKVLRLVSVILSISLKTLIVLFVGYIMTLIEPKMLEPIIYGINPISIFVLSSISLITFYVIMDER